MDTFGARLKHEREDRGLTIEAVSERVGVDRERLLALERNDFETLPDEAAMMACLSAYADCLRVDAELMIEDYVQERQKCLARLAEAIPEREVEIPAETVASPTSRRRPVPVLPVGFAVAVVVAIVGWWVLAPSSETPATPEPAATAVPEAVDEASAVAAPTPPEPAPVAQPQPRRSLPVAASPASMRIEDHGVGSAVRNRALLGESDRFSAGTTVWFWTRVEGGQAGDRIEHVWLDGQGRQVARIPLKIGGASWRTYSSKALRSGSSGRWAVEARDAEGRVLARSEFTCTP
jgi:transcriptional regulator with XRE-family HTH domain